MSQYFGMHNHTMYSNITAGLDCINKLPDLIARAKELGLSGLAITNHDNLSEVIEINRMQKRLRKAGDDFVLAIGNEIYLVDSFSAEHKERQKYYHMILIAKDKIGYQALVELSTRAWYRSGVQYGRRRVPTLKSDVEEILAQAKGHLVATTACLGGEFPTRLMWEEDSKYISPGPAEEFLEWCHEHFGKDDFYVELQPSTSKDQIAFNNAAEKFKAWDMDCNFIIATDAHYQNADDFPVFEAFMRSQQEKREVQEFYEFARLMSPQEITDLMIKGGTAQTTIDEAFKNTLKVASQIEFYDLAQEPKIPASKIIDNMPVINFPQVLHLTPDKYPTLNWALQSDDKQTLYCIHTCLNQLYERNIWNDQYLDRLEHEFEVMKFQSESLHDNFFKYANTMRYYLDLAWSIDCAVGPSRGSASGSLLNYLMDVVQCDPIQYELPFWRYLNKTRVTPLDIDTDFQPSKRPEFFQAIRDDRGGDLTMTQVATFRKLTLKAAIGNAARGYRSKDFPNGLDTDISTYLSSLIEIKRGFVATLKQTLEGDEVTGYNVNHTFIKECRAYPGLLDIIGKFEGIIVGSSTHAAAVILFDESDRLTDHCSLMRAPNGDMCTCLDLYTVEEAGCYKYDFLLLSTLDIQAACFKLLQRDGVINAGLSLKECFRTYINPNKIDFNQPQIWEKLLRNEVLSVFQWDAASGRKGIIAARPQNLFELTSLNGLIRLMTSDDEEDQIQRFIRFKENPALFEDEMRLAGLTDEQRESMHEELDRYNGCAATQESFMVLSQKIAGYSLKEADALRKTVAKKKMNEITAQKEFFFGKVDAPMPVKEYLWRVIIAPSLGYGFSLNHALPYSIIGVQCILMGGVLFHPIYWQTACLLQRSGALDGKSSDYNKIAKAVAALSRQGVNIRPIDINKSQIDFTHDATDNLVRFGLAAIKGLKTKAVDAIIELRPFESLFDFIVRSKADVTSIVALVKAGAFDKFGSRIEMIDALARFKSGQKEKLNGQNYLMIARMGLWPTHTEELKLSSRVFNFTQYLKNAPNGRLVAHFGYDMDEVKQWYQLDDRAREFLDEMDYIHDGFALNRAQWKYYYDLALAPMKQYLIDHQEEMLEKVNTQLIAEWREKYFPEENIAQWEIETMGICFAEHPLTGIKHVDDFDDLPQEPEVKNMWKTPSGRNVPIYHLTMIAGIAIAKDKLHSTITLLTPTGPVDVKLRKEQFAHYDAQISKQVDGKKKIIERSWLNRGNALIVHGMRQDDMFMAKKYKNSGMSHVIYKIVGKKTEGGFEIQKDRKKGKVEEDVGDAEE